MSITKTTLCCPRCDAVPSGNSNRLVTDSCGHQKCRSCFLADDECLECIQQQEWRSHSDAKVTQRISVDLPADFETTQEQKNSKQKGRKIASMPPHIRREQRDSHSDMHYHCNGCGKNFGSRSQQYYHLTCDNNVAKKYKCQQCDKAFRTSSHFNYHLETHAERTYYCQYCNKLFTNRLVLRKHEKLHRTIPLKCNECSKEYRSKESLRAHITQHRNDCELPYKCTECQKSYAVKSTLQQHMLKHLDKKYICQHCDKRFQRNYTLKLHLKKHTKANSFTCSTCLREFSDAAVLLRHTKLHEETTKYRCMHCDISIIRKDNMWRHIRTIHPDESFESCVEITNPNSLIIQIESKTRATIVDTPEAQQPHTFEPKTVENSAVIKSIGNVEPMKIPTNFEHTTSAAKLISKITQTDNENNASTNIATLTKLQAVSLNLNTSPITNATAEKKVRKKYDPIKMYRKILTTDCEDESESEKEETSNNKPRNIEKRLTLSTSNFSEMHWRKNFKYTYEYQEY